MVDVNTNNPDSIKYIKILFKGNKMVVTKELLKSRNVPDIGPISISLEEYIIKSKNLTQEQIENIMFSRSTITFTKRIQILT